MTDIRTCKSLYFEYPSIRLWLYQSALYIFNVCQVWQSKCQNQFSAVDSRKILSVLTNINKVQNIFANIFLEIQTIWEWLMFQRALLLTLNAFVDCIRSLFAWLNPGIVQGMYFLSIVLNNRLCKSLWWYYNFFFFFRADTNFDSMQFFCANDSIKIKKLKICVLPENWLKKVKLSYFTSNILSHWHVSITAVRAAVFIFDKDFVGAKI